MGIIQSIEKYCPCNQQEQQDKELILEFLNTAAEPFSRSNRFAHMTASAWIVNPERTKILMVYHRLYNSWAWTGGHADGEENLLAVALRETKEETGINQVQPVTEDIYSLEVLTVDGHEKRGEYVSSHLHMNVTYLLEAEENQPLRVCPEENTAVRWFELEEGLKASTEPWFVERVYRKLNKKINTIA